MPNVVIDKGISRKTPREQLLKMKAAVSRKCSQLRRLKREHARLQEQHALLVALCDAMEWLRQAVERSGGTCATSWASVELELLEHLQQLPYGCELASPANSSSSSGAADCSTASERLSSELVIEASSCGEEPQTLTTAADPLRVLRLLLEQPPSLVGADMTLQDLLQDYSATVRELALALQLHDSHTRAAAAGLLPPEGAMASGRCPLQTLKEAMMRHLLLCASMMLGNQGGLLCAIATVNVSSGELQPDSNRAHHRWVVQQLGLSSEQLRRIAAGVDVFQRVIEPVFSERQVLQRELSATAAAAAAASGDAPAQQQLQPQPQPAPTIDAGAAVQLTQLQIRVTSAASSNSSCSSALQPRSCTSGSGGQLREQALEEQRAVTNRLHGVVLKKDLLLRFIAGMFMYGALSIEQVARLHVLMMPLHPAPAVTLLELARLWHEQQQPAPRRASDKHQA